MFSTDPTHGELDGLFGAMNYFPSIREWITDNKADTVDFRFGVYCGVGIDVGCAVPEPSAIWLLFAGAVALILMKFSSWKS